MPAGAAARQPLHMVTAPPAGMHRRPSTAAVLSVSVRVLQVQAGYLGRFKVAIPWTRLWSSAIAVEIDRVVLVATTNYDLGNPVTKGEISAQLLATGEILTDLPPC